MALRAGIRSRASRAVYNFQGVERLQLNVYIASASDGVFTIKAVQMPELSAQARVNGQLFLPTDGH
ncbi:hypothetical protein PV772_22910 [Pseudarthrobacter sp. CC12]|uniref:hypothetical protein n=1 Tax=Pseudarthrobacter sp. CC12 TaxID=3029193 RepID=UPI003262E99E